MSGKTEALLSTLRLQPVVPVIIVEDVKSAVPLARALVGVGHLVGPRIEGAGDGDGFDSAPTDRIATAHEDECP